MFDVVDLFAGAGGLSLGAARAGFRLKAAVENDSNAIQTHKLNFPNSKHFDSDVSSLKGDKLLAELGIKKGELCGLIGGPPCQGFSVIGKRDTEDIRNELFDHFFRLVSELRPRFFLAENVLGILSPHHNDLRNTAFSKIKRHYVMLEPITIKASEYGVPTVRKRVFFIGYDKKNFGRELMKEDFLPSSDTERTFVRDALSGLPEVISPDWLTEEQGWQFVKKKNGNKFLHKVIGEIPEGVGDERSIKRYLEKNQVSGCQGTRHTDKVEERYRSLGSGKKDKISKSVKLNPDGFCPTLRAGTGSDKGRYQAVRPIHYNLPRVITPREAARLQGFPDWFVFHPTKWHSFRQIGNSVSPIVAEHLLKQIMNALNP